MFLPITVQGVSVLKLFIDGTAIKTILFIFSGHSCCFFLATNIENLY